MYGQLYTGFGSQLNILGPTNDFVTFCVTSYNTLGYLIYPPETVKRLFLSIYNWKYAKNTIIMNVFVNYRICFFVNFSKSKGYRA